MTAWYTSIQVSSSVGHRTELDNDSLVHLHTSVIICRTQYCVSLVYINTSVIICTTQDSEGQ